MLPRALRRFATLATLSLLASACCGRGSTTTSSAKISCTYDTDCTGGQVCKGEPTGTSSYCTASFGTPTGGVCDDREDCDHGSCLKKVGEDASPGICSKHCKTSAECPIGFQTCSSISDSAGVKYCLPGNANFAAPPSKKKTTTVVKPPPPSTPGTPGTQAGPPGGRPPGIVKK
jgi:hypothetical protein